MVKAMVKAMVKVRVKVMVNTYGKGSHKPPSRIRYEQTHPVVSIRVDQDTAATLKEISITAGKSLGELIKENLKIQKIKEDELEKREQKAYEQAVEDYKVWYYCARCGKKITIIPSGGSHKAIIEYMKKQGWRHKNC